MSVCLSYPSTLRLMDHLSKTHSVPLKMWIERDIVFKFWGDNVDKKKKVRDLRSDHQGNMVHMFSLLVGRSRTPAPELSHINPVNNLTRMTAKSFLPSSEDITRVKENLVVIVSRVLTQYFTKLASFAKVVPKHIHHIHSAEMSQKSEVYALDVLMKNEAKSTDMIDIMKIVQAYLGEQYKEERRVACGGDQLTCERQVGSQRHLMCGNTIQERLGLLEPVIEDWHCLVVFIKVSCKHDAL